MNPAVKFKSILASAVAMLFVFTATAVHADVKLPAIFGSHMVLQQNQPINVWGWAEPGESVTVTFGKSSTNAKADDDGNWKVKLPAVTADGKAHELSVVGKNKIKLTDVLIGEVWVGSGQSNMQWPLSQTHGAAEAIKAANLPNVRLIYVPRVQKPAPEKDFDAAWTTCTPETVPNFSAVLYYFGKKLNEELDIPIGLIHSSWGGSPIEPWIVKGKSSGNMYNGMIAPLQPFSIKGSIWYQGETNVIRKNGLTYTGKMADLINGWRKAWNSDLSFHFVQIAPWSGKYAPGQLPALWEAQAATLKLPKTGMAVVTDLVDNIADIHPRNKLDVGNRLALWALAKDYGKTDVVYSGPFYKSLKVEGNKAKISFAHLGGGLKSRDEKPLTEFEIAGADNKFVKAQAMIEGDVVVVTAEGVKTPTQVRFGWHKLANPNLINSAGLPAAPFQTKNWTGVTGE